MKSARKLVNREEMERVLQAAGKGEVSKAALANWVAQVHAGDEFEVDEKDNDLIWMVVHWLGDCVDDPRGCDPVAMARRFQRVLAAAPVSRDAEALLWFVGGRDFLVDTLTKVEAGVIPRSQYESLVDERHLWPQETRRLMKSLPDRTPDAFLVALRNDDYQTVARILGVGD